jgi:outer membrane biosynthesis protein TonB
MFRFTIRDLLWLMLAVAIVAAMFWNRQHAPKSSRVEMKTVEVTIEPDGSTTTKAFDP